MLREWYYPLNFPYNSGNSVDDHDVILEFSVAGTHQCPHYYEAWEDGNLEVIEGMRGGLTCPMS